MIVDVPEYTGYGKEGNFKIWLFRPINVKTKCKKESDFMANQTKGSKIKNFVIKKTNKQRTTYVRGTLQTQKVKEQQQKDKQTKIR